MNIATQPLPFLTSEQAAVVRRKFRAETTWNNVNMKLIGGWQDLAGFYHGSDGNVWTLQSSWSNGGPIEAFFRNVRGGLFNS